MPKLSDYDQFILVRVEPDGALGKAVKTPVNAAGIPVSPLDSSNWLSYDDASSILSISQLKLGFVLTEADPFFCLDIDQCLMPDNSDWTALAHDVMNACAGTVNEISQSGRGLHLWGCYEHMPAHKCRNIQHRLELYHEKRFILLGDIDPTAELPDASSVLPNVIGRWFKPDPTDRNGSAEWTTEACEGWAGPASDDELIAKALASVNASSVFGSTVSFRDLWEANADALGNVWPHETSDYDASSADAALAQRLAFWTGRNCERMQRMMQRSALARDKYERPDYLPRTILGACARQVQVYSAASKADVERVAATGGWVNQADLPTHFSGCVFIEDRKRIMTPDGSLLDKEQFDVRYGGNVYVLDESKNDRSAWKAFTQCTYWRPPHAHTSCFRPTLPLGALIEEESRIMCNTFAPVDVPKVEGDVSRFTTLVKRLLPDAEDREILLSYMAACVQHAGVKFSWCPILQGVQGNGKTLLGEIMAYSCGRKYSFVLSPDQLKGSSGSRFNGWVDRRLFVCIEEVYVGAHKDMIERLKPLITNTRISIEDKGVSMDMGENRANFLLLTNYIDAMPLTNEDRRYAPLLTAQQRAADLTRDGLTNAFFVDFFKWLNEDKGWAKIAHYLNTYNIAEQYNPAGICRTAPNTTGRETVMLATRCETEELLVEAAQSNLPGFAGGWLSMTALNAHIERARVPRLSNAKRRTLLDRLGYIPHPHLRDGRTPRAVAPDACRPTLYVKADSVAAQIEDPMTICGAYERAQTATAIEAAQLAQSGAAS